MEGRRQKGVGPTGSWAGQGTWRVFHKRENTIAQGERHRKESREGGKVASVLVKGKSRGHVSGNGGKGGGYKYIAGQIEPREAKRKGVWYHLTHEDDAEGRGSRKQISRSGKYSAGNRRGEIL